MYAISRYDKNKYNIKTRLYYDFDLTYVLGDWDEMKTMIKDDVFETTQDILLRYFNIEIGIQDMVVLDSSRKPEKLSLHFVFNVFFDNLSKVKDFTDNYLPEKFKEEGSGFDKNVYHTSSQNFRIVGCTKRGKQRFLQIVSNHTEEESMICYIPPNCRHVDIKPIKIKFKNNEQPVILTPSYQQQLEKLYITNIDVFSNLSHDYYSWIKIGRALYSANCSVSTFHLFLKYDKKI